MKEPIRLPDRQPVQDHQSKTMKLEEWAREVGIGRSLAYDLARRNEIPGLIRLGNRYLVSRAVTKRILNEGWSANA